MNPFKDNIDFEILKATLELHDLLEIVLLEKEEAGFPEVKTILKKINE